MESVETLFRTRDREIVRNLVRKGQNALDQSHAMRNSIRLDGKLPREEIAALIRTLKGYSAIIGGICETRRWGNEVPHNLGFALSQEAGLLTKRAL